MNKKTLIILVFLVVLADIFLSRNNQPSTSTQTPLSDNPVIEEDVMVSNETKEFDLIAKKWSFEPNTITVNQGDTVKLTIKSLDVDHGFFLREFNVNQPLEPGQTTTVEFLADKTGTFTFSCNVFCGQGHGTMKGKLIVK